MIRFLDLAQLDLPLMLYLGILVYSLGLMAAKYNDLPYPSSSSFDFPAIDEQHGRLFTMGVIEAARDIFIEQFIKDRSRQNRLKVNRSFGSIVECKPKSVISNDFKGNHSMHFLT